MDETPLRIGIEIGGTKTQVVLGDGTGRIVERRRYSVDRASGGAGIRQKIEEGLRELLQPRVEGVGIGFGGPVDWRTGTICCSHHVEGWSGFPLGPWVAELAGVSTRVDNDANTAALGEARLGAGQGRNPVFYVTLGSGVGGGLVVAGQIYHGAVPGEAEIGHLRLDRAGTILEHRCSGWSVDRRLREAARQAPGTLLGQTLQGLDRGEARHWSELLAQGSPEARRILEETADDLAFGLSHVAHLCHPEVIVVGGGLALVGEVLREAVQRRLGSYLMEAFAPGPEVRLAALGEDAVPIGALLLAGTLH